MKIPCFALFELCAANTTLCEKKNKRNHVWGAHAVSPIYMRDELAHPRHACVRQG